jgi:hypothetical protein
MQALAPALNQRSLLADFPVESLCLLQCMGPALRVISLRCGIWSLSGHSGLWQAVRPPGDLWVHRLDLFGDDRRRHK